MASLEAIYNRLALVFHKKNIAYKIEGITLESIYSQDSEYLDPNLDHREKFKLREAIKVLISLILSQLRPMNTDVLFQMAASTHLWLMHHPHYLASKITDVRLLKSMEPMINFCLRPGVEIFDQYYLEHSIK